MKPKIIFFTIHRAHLQSMIKYIDKSMSNLLQCITHSSM